MGREPLRHLHREPLVHFLLLGGLLFALYLLVDRGRGLAGAASPAPSAIEVTEGEVARLEDSFAQAASRAPSAAELDQLVRAFVREEALYREARALGLDRGDPVVRRRLVDKMAFLLRDGADEGRLLARYPAV